MFQIKESKKENSSNSKIMDICRSQAYNWNFLPSQLVVQVVLFVCGKSGDFEVSDVRQGIFTLSTKVVNKSDKFAWFPSIAYGLNDPVMKPDLWRELNYVGSRCPLPWLIASNFGTIPERKTRDLLFTWSNEQAEDPIMSRTDMLLISDRLLLDYPDVVQVAMLRPTPGCMTLGFPLFRFETWWFSVASFQSQME